MGVSWIRKLKGPGQETECFSKPKRILLWKLEGD
jgi:hypothetical protein